MRLLVTVFGLAVGPGVLALGCSPCSSDQPSDVELVDAADATSEHDVPDATLDRAADQVADLIDSDSTLPEGGPRGMGGLDSLVT